MSKRTQLLADMRKNYIKRQNIFARIAIFLKISRIYYMVDMSGDIYRITSWYYYNPLFWLLVLVIPFFIALSAVIDSMTEFIAEGVFSYYKSEKTNLGRLKDEYDN